jgi:adenylate cyclase
MVRPSGPIAFFLELRRRRVLRVAALYAAMAWLIIQIVATAFPHLSLPSWAITLVIVLLLIAFPFVVMLGWAYDLTPDGVRRAEAAPGAGSAHRRGPLARYGTRVLVLAGALLLGGYLHVARGGGAGSPANVAAVGEEAPSIAVLPFVNMSADPENEYFSDGLTEELLNVLAQVEGLRVAARTSAFAFKNVAADVTEIGERLNVEWVLEGSVRKAGERLRVTAQLIHASNGYHAWSDTFESERTADIFSIQDSISRAILAKLLPRVTRMRLALHGGTRDIRAYEEYLKGRYAFWQGTAEADLRRAIRHYEAAVERDPGFALAWAGLSDANMLLGGQHASPQEAFPRAKAAAQRALELDDQLAEGYVALASINWFYDWDWAAAERNYRRSFSVNRVVYTRCICYVLYLAALGDVDAAVREGERARALDPLSHLPMTTLAQMYFRAGRMEDARALLGTLEQAGSTSSVVPRLHAWLAWEEGRRGDALAQLERYAATRAAPGSQPDGVPPVAVAELAYMHGESGNRAQAAALAAALEGRAVERYVPPEYVAVAHAAAGDLAGAERWLERAYEQRSNLGVFSVQPVARALAALPAYDALLRRIRLPRTEVGSGILATAP